MKKHFYTHLVEIDSLIIELDSMDLSAEEKLHLAQLVDSNLHHTVLDAILSELGDEDKEKFIKHLNSDEHEKIWEILNQRVDNIEDKIKSAAEQLKSELHKDINEAKGRKNE